MNLVSRSLVCLLALFAGIASGQVVGIGNPTAGLTYDIIGVDVEGVPFQHHIDTNWQNVTGAKYSYNVALKVSTTSGYNVDWMNVTCTPLDSLGTALGAPQVFTEVGNHAYAQFANVPNIAMLYPYWFQWTLPGIDFTATPLMVGGYLLIAAEVSVNGSTYEDNFFMTFDGLLDSGLASTDTTNQATDVQPVDYGTGYYPGASAPAGPPGWPTLVRPITYLNPVREPLQFFMRPASRVRSGVPNTQYTCTTVDFLMGDMTGSIVGIGSQVGSWVVGGGGLSSYMFTTYHPYQLAGYTSITWHGGVSGNEPTKTWGGLQILIGL